MKTILFLAAIAWAHGEVDTLMNVNLNSVEVVSSPKEVGSMRQQPASVTMIDQKEIERQHITSIKGVAAVAPNFFMPDYGSRLTSAIYIRGIGSRINTPAVGLYVDNIPYVDKSAFDFNFYDIERIDVMRGPQSTLYGRNTMGGLVKVYTKNPMSYQGTDLRLGFATRDSHRTAALTHYHRVSDRFAFSAGGYYEGSNGFFKNNITGHEIDDVQAGGGRMRAIFMPNEKLKFDATINYDYTDEGAYPYYYKENIGGGMDDLLGKISANHEGRYRRGLFNAGVNTEYKMSEVVLTSVTGYQKLDDRMQMDQDFMQPDYYCMLQEQNSDVLSEELMLKNRTQKAWNWMVGGSAFYQWLTTEAPVTFYKDGIQTLIEDNINSVFKGLKQTYPKMPNMALKVKDDEFRNSSSLKTPLFNLALFHQSSFVLGHWDITAGLRLDYEKMKLNYSSASLINYDFTISMPPMMNMTIPGMKANPTLAGKKDKDYLTLLPKLAVKYTFDHGVSPSFAYASVSRGFRSGGYNIQLISDLVQGQMRGLMMDSINVASHGMMEKYVDIESIKTKADISSVVYKPEYSWNYEAGVHLSRGIYDAQIALFYSKIYDQQISRFVSSGLGRVMMNAGESESFGLELTFNAGEYFSLAYGYTQAKFNDYDDGTNDYTGNYVPFVPQHTLNVRADYPVEWGRGKVKMTIGADYTAAGRIYWTEANNASQDFYGTLGAHVAFDFSHIGINVWGRNLADADYDTFYFESLGHGLAQHGKPIQFGVDVRIRL